MRRQSFLEISSIFVALALVALGCGKRDVNSANNIEWPPLKPAREVDGTTIVPTLDTPLEDAGNAIWCATFQVAWNKACDDVVGGPLEVANAEAVAKRLNDSPVTEAVLPPGSYFAVAGAPEEGIAEEIRKQMAKKFPGVEPPKFENADGLVAYAYLSVAVKFTTPFEERTRPIEFTNAAGESSDVEGFCLYSGHDEEITSDQLSQIKVLFREPTDDPKSRRLAAFALDLTADQDDTQVIIAVLPHATTLQAVLDDLEQRAKAYDGPSYISEADTLAIPNVLFNLENDFDELTGPDKLILNSERLQGNYLDVAWQMIRFNLDKNGAIVESEAMLAVAASAVAEAQHYDYIADRPFLVVMKRRGEKHPYFAAWYGNAELLKVRGG